MRCLFCLWLLRRYSIPHFFIAIIQFFCINKQPTLLAQQPALAPLTRHFQSNDKISKNLFHGRRIVLSAQPNCFSISTPYFSHRKSTAFSLQSHCFYPPIPQLLPSKNIAFAPPKHHPVKTKFIFKSLKNKYIILEVLLILIYLPYCFVIRMFLSNFVCSFNNT